MKVTRPAPATLGALAKIRQHWQHRFLCLARMTPTAMKMMRKRWSRKESECPGFPPLFIPVGVLVRISGPHYTDTLSLGAPKWKWAKESSVAGMIARVTADGREQHAADTDTLDGLFPPFQRYQRPSEGGYRCRAMVSISKETGQWGLGECKHRVYKGRHEFRRHLMCDHLGDLRAEERGMQPTHPRCQMLISDSETQSRNGRAVSKENFETKGEEEEPQRRRL